MYLHSILWAQMCFRGWKDLPCSCCLLGNCDCLHFDLFALHVVLHPEAKQYVELVNLGIFPQTLSNHGQR